MRRDASTLVSTRIFLVLVLLIVTSTDLGPHPAHQTLDTESDFIPVHLQKPRQAILTFPLSSPNIHARVLPRSVAWPPAPGNLTHDNLHILPLSRRLLNHPTITQLLAVTTCGAQPQIRALYCPVPGAASKTLFHHLSRSLCLIPLSSLALRDRQRLLLSPVIPRVVFVRHPFVRILASFLRGSHSTRLSSPHYRQFISNVRGIPLRPQDRELNSLSFRMFLALLAQHDVPSPLSEENPDTDPTSDLHEDFRPQSRLCAVNVVDYTFVGKVENFAHDLHALNRLLYIKTSALPPMPSPSGASSQANRFFKSIPLRRRATHLLRQDLDAFGYAPDQL